MIRIALAVACVLTVFSPAAWSAPPHRPLDQIFLDLEDAGLPQVKRIARQMAQEQFQMDNGPLYKSTPPVQNRDPKVLSDEVIFEGHIVAKSSKCKLALHSDDGCDM